MPDPHATAQEVRAVLAKWTANDWRHAFGLAPDLDAALRRGCAVPDHEPLANNAGALAMPVLTRLNALELDDLALALGPLAVQLEHRRRADPDGLAADVGPGPAALASCRLALHPALADQLDRTEPPRLPDLVPALEDQQPQALAAAQQVLADVEAGRPVRHADLTVLRRWNDDLARASAVAGTAAALPALQDVLHAREQQESDAGRRAELAALLREVADAPLGEGAREVLAEVLDDAATGVVTPEREEAFRALHRLLAQQSWEVDDADVERVEQAFGRKAARVAVAEAPLR